MTDAAVGLASRSLRSLRLAKWTEDEDDYLKSKASVVQGSRVKFALSGQETTGVCAGICGFPGR